MSIFKNKLFQQDVLIFTLLVIIIGSLIFISFRNTNQIQVSNYCKPTGIQSGTIIVKINVTNTANYKVWLNVESPMQINFNDLPDIYNPLLVGIDNNTCYKVGNGQIIPLNSWVWINGLNNNSGENFSVSLKKGIHTFTISGVYISIDQIKLIKDSCIPVLSGSNCPDI